MKKKSHEVERRDYELVDEKSLSLVTYVTKIDEKKGKGLAHPPTPVWFHLTL